MFIKKINKSNKNSKKIYTYYRLIESYRTKNGPRHRTILNLGRLNIPRKEFKILADRIEEILTGQKSFFPKSSHIETLAQHYANIIIKKKIKLRSLRKKSSAKEKEPRYITIDIHSTKTRENRSIGGEHIGLSIIKELKLDKYLKQLGFSEKQLNAALLCIIGRLLSPNSERWTYQWCKRISGLGELLDVDFSRYGRNILYRTSDKLYEHKKEIEDYLTNMERDLFSLKETMLLYDLTNTFFEGKINKSELKRRGHSKEKRSNAPLVTLGLILDENGFPKTSRIFKGNVSEPDTLKTMLDELSDLLEDNKKPTVVMDAGIATEDNIKLIKNEYKYDYIVVSRKKINKYNGETLITIKENKKNKLEAYLYRDKNEAILYCKSRMRLLKEEAICQKLRKHFEEDLEGIRSSIHKKGGRKKYEYVLERIGRAKQKFSKVSRFYDIEIKTNDKKTVTDIIYKISKLEEMGKRFSGSYYLRTSRLNLAEKEIWDIYIMLTDVESAFRAMKHELGMRPIYHQKDKRIQSHLFITVLAYHIQKIIRSRLKKEDINEEWSSIRSFMSTHQITTVTQNIKDRGKLYIRDCSEPETYHEMIYHALKISNKPLNSAVMVL
jgi:hypothetical protein